MENLQPETARASAAPQRWPFLFVGILLCLLGPVIYWVRCGQHHLETPWYVPVLTSIGVLFMVVSVWQRRGVLRSVVLVLFVLVCCFEWYFVVVITKTPQYTGPALPGHKMPAFAAQQSMANALQVLHTGAGQKGDDTNAPTTFLVDGTGTVRWFARPERFLDRLAPDEVLAAIDEVKQRK